MKDFFAKKKKESSVELMKLAALSDFGTICL
jgi:hypothetical protein